MLASHGVCIEKTVNFLEYYREYKEDYKELFTKFRLNFDVGKQMDPELWEIVHLYRVLICRKISNGKRLRDFGLQQRQLAATKEIQRKLDKGNRNHGHNHHHRDR